VRLLEGQIAVVTGAGQGLGRAIALEYVREGAHVALLDMRADLIEAVAAEAGDNARAYPLDITDYHAYANVLQSVIAWGSRIDILVNNAGIFTSGTILDDRLDDWQRVLRVNLEAVYMGSKMVAPGMVARRSGRIIHLASVAGDHSRGSVGPYNASKGAVIAYTKSMAVELAPYNVQVNAIAPGFMRTSMMADERGVDLTTLPDFRDGYIERGKIPMRRAGEPEDVAGAAVFLASSYCRYMTGTVLVVDGGLTSTF
jgi:3-oxoacyl-[acyl-carrier protein] reductase